MRYVMRLFLLLLVPGCVSLDPAADIRSASDLVESRAGMETGWSRPWNEQNEAWDSRSELSSDTAVRIALQNNRALRGQVEAIVATRADFVQAHLLPNPILSAAIGFPTDGLGGDPLGVALVQQLAWLWRRPAAIDSADAALRTQVLTVSDAALRLVADVRRVHARVVFAERSLEIQRDNVDVLTDSVDLIERRFAVGEVSKLEVNELGLELERTRARLSDRTAALALAQRDLVELLACAEVDDTWRTDGAVPRASVVEHLDEETVVAMAISQRLDVAAAAATLDGGRARLEFANGGRLPDVSVGVEYRQNFATRPGVFPSVSVTPKVFDDNSARIARAASELAQTEIEADRVRQAAIAETRRAWISLSTEREVVASYEQEIVRRADENLVLARASLDAGEIDMTTLLATQRRLNDVRLELVDRRQAAASAFFELERASGGALTPGRPHDTLVATTIHAPPQIDQDRESSP